MSKSCHINSLCNSQARSLCDPGISRAASDINKKGSFYQKRAHRISPPLVQNFLKRFYNKIRFVNVS